MSKDLYAFVDGLVQSDPWPVPRRVFIVGEIGINHNGDLNVAKQLIEMARSAGCDAVKFQKRQIDVVYSADVLDSPRESPWGTTQREQKEGLEFGRAEYDEIDRFCREKNIEWFASAWDVPSQHFLRQYDLKFNKIASAMITHRELLDVVAQEKKLTLISTGMSLWEQIDAAVAVFKKHDCPFILMHTVSEYPAPEDRLNLRCINTLRERYRCPVGYSGHENAVSPSVVAATMGAVAIERHITLDRAMYGSDQAASLELVGLRAMVEQIRKVSVILGDGVKRITKVEEDVSRKLRYWRPSDRI